MRFEVLNGEEGKGGVGSRAEGVESVGEELM